MSSSTEAAGVSSAGNHQSGDQAGGRSYIVRADDPVSSVFGWFSNCSPTLVLTLCFTEPRVGGDRQGRLSRNFQPKPSRRVGKRRVRIPNPHRIPTRTHHTRYTDYRYPNPISLIRDSTETR